MAHYNTTELSGYTVVFFYHILQHSEGKIMLFSFSIIFHAYALLVPKVNTYFCIFVRIHPFWSQGSYSWTLLVDSWTLGSKWASSILHTFYIVQLYTVVLFFFWLILFLFGCWIFFLAIFFCFQYAYFFDYFLLFKNFFHHLCIWKRNMRVRGKKLFNKNICFILREK
jgi:hypothetical protein